MNLKTLKRWENEPGCPYCGAHSGKPGTVGGDEPGLNVPDPTYEGRMCFMAWSCSNCGSEWLEQFTREGVIDLNNVFWGYADLEETA